MADPSGLLCDCSKAKTRKNYSTFSNETTSKVKVLPQGKNFGWDL